jgi:alpha-mannosidase
VDASGTLSAGPVSIDLARRPRLNLGGLVLAPELSLHRDPSDTWSHGVTRFEGERLAIAHWQPATTADGGPLLAAAIQMGRIGDSLLRAEWRLNADDAAAELLLTVDWRASNLLLKLALRLDAAVVGRTDGVLGGALRRDLEARERPLRDYTLLRLAGGARVGVVCPDVYALDLDDGHARLTLLRSPFMAHHDPVVAEDHPRRVLADQGRHHFRFQFLSGADLTVEELERRALMMQRPPLVAEGTRGMIVRSAW